MRRSLILTVAASVAMVLLAMLVPMALLVRSYALEDRISRAALELQATETIVSGQDKGAVNQYVERVNSAGETRTTVLYPDGTAIGPDPGEDRRVLDARNTGRARVDDVGDGSQILVPVSRGGNSALPSQTPVVRVIVPQPGLTSDLHRAWFLLAGLGLVLLIGSLVLADRLGRSFVGPIRALAAYTTRLGAAGHPEPVHPEGPPEVRELGAALNRLVERVDLLLARERESVTDLAHRLRTPITALRLRIEALDDTAERRRLDADLDDLQGTVDRIVREARRSEREGLDPRTDALAVLRRRINWWAPLADDQGRDFEVVVAPGPDRPMLRTSPDDLSAVVDVLLDNVFTHTPEQAAVRVSLSARPDGIVLVVEDGGGGIPDEVEAIGRGASGAGSSGLGLAIAERTAHESGGALEVGGSDLGGARVSVTLGVR